MDINQIWQTLQDPDAPEDLKRRIIQDHTDFKTGAHPDLRYLIGQVETSEKNRGTTLRNIFQGRMYPVQVDGKPNYIIPNADNTGLLLYNEYLPMTGGDVMQYIAPYGEEAITGMIAGGGKAGVAVRAGRAALTSEIADQVMKELLQAGTPYRIEYGTPDERIKQSAVDIGLETAGGALGEKAFQLPGKFAHAMKNPWDYTQFSPRGASQFESETTPFGFHPGKKIDFDPDTSQIDWDRYDPNVFEDLAAGQQPQTDTRLPGERFLFEDTGSGKDDVLVGPEAGGKPTEIPDDIQEASGVQRHEMPDGKFKQSITTPEGDELLYDNGRWYEKGDQVEMLKEADDPTSGVSLDKQDRMMATAGWKRVGDGRAHSAVRRNLANSGKPLDYALGEDGQLEHAPIFGGFQNDPKDIRNIAGITKDPETGQLKLKGNKGKEYTYVEDEPFSYTQVESRGGFRDAEGFTKTDTYSINRKLVDAGLKDGADLTTMVMENPYAIDNPVQPPIGNPNYVPGSLEKRADVATGKGLYSWWEHVETDSPLWQKAAEEYSLYKDDDIIMAQDDDMSDWVFDNGGWAGRGPDELDEAGDIVADGEFLDSNLAERAFKDEYTQYSGMHEQNIHGMDFTDPFNARIRRVGVMRDADVDVADGGTKGQAPAMPTAADTEKGAGLEELGFDKTMAGFRKPIGDKGEAIIYNPTTGNLTITTPGQIDLKSDLGAAQKIEQLDANHLFDDMSPGNTFDIEEGKMRPLTPEELNERRASYEGGQVQQTSQDEFSAVLAYKGDPPIGAQGYLRDIAGIEKNADGNWIMLGHDGTPAFEYEDGVWRNIRTGDELPDSLMEANWNTRFEKYRTHLGGPMRGEDPAEFRHEYTFDPKTGKFSNTFMITADNDTPFIDPAENKVTVFKSTRDANDDVEGFQKQTFENHSEYMDWLDENSWFENEYWDYARGQIDKHYDDLEAKAAEAARVPTSMLVEETDADLMPSPKASEAPAQDFKDVDAATNEDMFSETPIKQDIAQPGVYFLNGKVEGSPIDLPVAFYSKDEGVWKNMQTQEVMPESEVNRILNEGKSKIHKDELRFDPERGQFQSKGAPAQAQEQPAPEAPAQPTEATETPREKISTQELENAGFTKTEGKLEPVMRGETEDGRAVLYYPDTGEFRMMAKGEQLDKAMQDSAKKTTELKRAGDEEGAQKAADRATSFELSPEQVNALFGKNIRNTGPEVKVIEEPWFGGTTLRRYFRDRSQKDNNLLTQIAGFEEDETGRISTYYAGKLYKRYDVGETLPDGDTAVEDVWMADDGTWVPDNEAMISAYSNIEDQYEDSLGTGDRIETALKETMERFNNQPEGEYARMDDVLDFNPSTGEWKDVLGMETWEPGQIEFSSVTGELLQNVDGKIQPIKIKGAKPAAQPASADEKVFEDAGFDKFEVGSDKAEVLRGEFKKGDPLHDYFGDKTYIFHPKTGKIATLDDSYSLDMAIKDKMPAAGQAPVDNDTMATVTTDGETFYNAKTGKREPIPGDIAVSEKGKLLYETYIDDGFEWEWDEPLPDNIDGGTISHMAGIRKHGGDLVLQGEDQGEFWRWNSDQHKWIGSRNTKDLSHNEAEGIMEAHLEDAGFYNNDEYRELWDRYPTNGFPGGHLKYDPDNDEWVLPHWKKIEDGEQDISPKTGKLVEVEVTDDGVEIVEVDAPLKDLGKGGKPAAQPAVSADEQILADKGFQKADVGTWRGQIGDNTYIYHPDKGFRVIDENYDFAKATQAGEVPGQRPLTQEELTDLTYDEATNTVIDKATGKRVPIHESTPDREVISQQIDYSPAADTGNDPYLITETSYRIPQADADKINEYAGLEKIKDKDGNDTWKLTDQETGKEYIWEHRITEYTAHDGKTYPSNEGKWVQQGTNRLGLGKKQEYRDGYNSIPDKTIENNIGNKVENDKSLDYLAGREYNYGGAPDDEFSFDPRSGEWSYDEFRSHEEGEKYVLYDNEGRPADYVEAVADPNDPGELEQVSVKDTEFKDLGKGGKPEPKPELPEGEIVDEDDIILEEGTGAKDDILIGPEAPATSQTGDVPPNAEMVPNSREILHRQDSKVTDTEWTAIDPSNNDFVRVRQIDMQVSDRVRRNKKLAAKAINKYAKKHSINPEEYGSVIFNLQSPKAYKAIARDMKEMVKDGGLSRTHLSTGQLSGDPRLQKAEMKWGKKPAMQAIALERAYKNKEILQEEFDKVVDAIETNKVPGTTPEQQQAQSEALFRDVEGKFSQTIEPTAKPATGGTMADVKDSIHSGFNKSNRDIDQKHAKLWEDVENLMDTDAVFAPLDNVQAALERVQDKLTPEAAALIDDFMARNGYEEGLGGAAPMSDLIQLRNDLYANGIGSGDTFSQAEMANREIFEAIDDEVRLGIRAELDMNPEGWGSDVLEALQKAVNYTEQQRPNLQFRKNLLTGKSAEQITATLLEGSKSGGTLLNETLKGLSKENQEALRVNLMKNIGFDADGAFSGPKFVENWHNLHPNARKALVPDASHRANLDKIASVAKTINNEAYLKAFQEGTGNDWIAAFLPFLIPGGVTGGFGYWLAGPWGAGAGAVTGLIAPKTAWKILTHKGMAKWIASAAPHRTRFKSRWEENRFLGHVGRLTAMAESDEAMADDIAAYASIISNAMEGDLNMMAYDSPYGPSPYPTNVEDMMDLTTEAEGPFRESTLGHIGGDIMEQVQQTDTADFWSEALGMGQ